MRASLQIGCVALLLSACTTRTKVAEGLNTFEVTLSQEASEQPKGTAEAPLAFVTGRVCAQASHCDPGEQCIDNECSRCYRIDVTARGNKGEEFDFDGTLRVTVAPGLVTGSTQFAQMVDGRIEGHEVCFNRNVGRTNIWVEHDGVVPRPDDVKFGQCNDGLDNDDNGLTDMADPGCASAEDHLEGPVTGAAGASDDLLFQTPAVDDLQRTTLVRNSPMQGLHIVVERGPMVVTNVVGNGFYVTDMDAAKEPKPFASVFIFTFSVPEGVQLNDLVCWFSGNVEEHVGHTQVIFPSFETHRWDDPEIDLETCRRDISFDINRYPQAPGGQGADLTDQLAVETGPFDGATIGNNSLLLEAYEASLVTLRNIAVPTRFIACDGDGSGSVDNNDERECRNQCNDDPGCSDLESYFEFRQWLGIVDGRKRMGFSVALAHEFTPLDIDFLGQDDQLGLCTRETTPLGFLQYHCPERTVAAITGSLRHIYLCGSTGGNDCGLQFWILDPRFDEDVKLTGDAP